jgi:mycofactocin precursor
MSAEAVESTLVTGPVPAQPKVLPTTVVRDAPPAPEKLVESDLLVEDVSIDGMCGVY